MFHIGQNIRVLLKALAFGVPVGVSIIDVVGYVARVEGHSMQPQLNPKHNSKDYVFLYNWPVVSNSFDEITRGDIVSLVSPKDPRQRLIKRVIGLEGDIVETHGYKTAFVRIPQGHCWVEGDHKANSLDSNSFGPIALGLIKSKATWIVWPPSRWQTLSPINKSSSSAKGHNNPTLHLVEDRDSDTFRSSSHVDKLS